MFKIGDRVRHCTKMLYDARDSWQSEGREPYKGYKKDAYDKLCAERGTVTAFLPGNPAKYISPGIEVKWDNGSISHCLDYRVEKVEG